MKKHLTKIVATIGPSCESEEMIEKLILAGVDVFRFNLKHNNLDWHSQEIRKVKRISEKLKKDIGTLIDLQGPELRVNMSNEEIVIIKDKLYELKDSEIYISHPEIIKHLKTGQKVFVDDGSIEFIVENKENKTFLRALCNGILKNKKNFNVPGADFPIPCLVQKDYEALAMGFKDDVDFIALSFVRSKNDVQTLRQEIDKLGYRAKIIAKIETVKAVENIDQIIKISDGLMVARGDLGVEASLEKVPYFQKQLIKKAFQKGIPVITATQMLQSMVVNSYPTRAEVSDVANAFYDLTDAVMLSAESASGKYPRESVSMMSKILSFNEENNVIDSRINFNFDIKDRASLVCDCAYNLYRSFKSAKKNLAGYLVFTETGMTARMISRYRPLLPIFTFASSKKVANSLSLDFGVQTFIYEGKSKNQVVKDDILEAISVLKEKNLVKKGETLIVLHGDHWAVKGGTSTIKIIDC